MEKDFMKSKLPRIFKKNGQDAYLDPIRQKLIYVTPEETVRQHLISFLIDELKVPKNLISIEEPLKHYGVKSNERADIIIDAYDEKENIFNPIAVIECKAPEIYLDDAAFNQVENYSNKLGCIYCWLTNGEENFCYYFDENKDDYVQIDELPIYDEMLQGKYNLAPIEEPQPRIKFDELDEKYSIYVESGDIGENTPKNLAIPMVNFSECLLDLNHKLPKKDYKIFRLIEDYGIRNLSLGNPGGGNFCGPYRSFLVEYNGNINFVSFLVSVYCTFSNPNIMKTAINVSIDTDEGNIHNSLQLVVDKNVETYGEKIRFFHHGKTTKGRRALKIDGLRELVSEKYPEIVYGKKFYLGTLTHNRLFYLDDPEVMKVVENLISYALIRDDYRAIS